MSLQVLLPLGSALAAALPRRVAEALADRSGDLAAGLARHAATTLLHNHRRLTGSTPSPAARRGAFRTYARYYLGVMRLAHQPVDAALGPCRWDGVEHLDASLQRGRGALVLSAHLGHWDLLGVRLAERYGTLCVFVEPLRPPRLFEFYTQVRSRHGVQIAPVGAPGRAPIDTLRRNGILAFPADRPFGSRAIEVEAAGGRLAIPAGAIRLALRAGAPIHAVFACRSDDGYRLEVGPDSSAGLDPALPMDARVARIAGGFVARLREVVGRHPDQWCMMQALGAGQGSTAGTEPNASDAAVAAAPAAIAT